MSRTLLVSTLLVLTASLAGCAAEDEITAAKIEKSYKDAPKRFYNSVGGAEDVTQTINIPAGKAQLTIKAIYSVGGAADFTLKNPAGQVEKRDETAGSKQVESDEWYSTTNPTPGAWKFQIEIAGSGQYAFGFYY